MNLLAHADELTHGLDPGAAARMFFRMADRYRRSGRWDLAAETFTAMLERYPDDALCRAARVWLMQYYACGEWANQPARVAGKSRLEQAVALGRELERTRPELFAEPGIRFPLAAACRRLEQPTERCTRPSGTGGPAMHGGPAPWPKRGWPSARGRRPVRCCRAAGRPSGHGWTGSWTTPCGGRPGPPRGPAPWATMPHGRRWSCWPTMPNISMWAFTAARPPGQNTRPKAASADGMPTCRTVTASRFFLDLDRDYATYYHVTIDYRGWATDACWGDATWNPKWFVAARTADGAWSRRGGDPARGTVGQGWNLRHRNDPAWADRLGHRHSCTVPGVGFQSWTTPAATTVVPEGFGLLGFE